MTRRTPRHAANMPPDIEIPGYASAVLQRLERLGFEAYVVGGCVRDSLMGCTPKDWDICTNATPAQTLEAFRRFHVIKTGLKHGTVTVMSERKPIEVTTFRIDGEYSDNRHPDAVTFVPHVEQDLARRDFTINAMAYRPGRGLVDAFGGQGDLESRLIRCVGEPDARFQEDGLRILRALRFAARYDFDIERETAFSIRRNRGLLEHVSAERIFKELKGILAGKGAAGMLRAFPDVFSVIIPELAPCIGFDLRNKRRPCDAWTHAALAVQAAPQEETLRLALLLHDIAKPLCFSQDAQGRSRFDGHAGRGAEMARAILGRLKSDNDTKDTVAKLVAEHSAPFPADRPGMRRLVGRLGPDLAQKLLAMRRADHAAWGADGQEAKAQELRNAALLLDDVMAGAPAFTVRDLAVNGRDLMQLGIAPGPALGETLGRLLAAVQADRLANTREALLGAAAKLP